MSISQELTSKLLSFELEDGSIVFPVRMKRRDTGRLLFRVAQRGNTLADCEEVEEAVMLDKVLAHGYAVRCSSANRKRAGLYRIGARAIRSVRRAHQAA